MSKDVAGGLSGISSAPGLPIQVPPQSLTSTSDERSQVTNDHVSNMEAVEVGEAENREEDWTAHRTADGRVYYYDSVSGKSTYERPAGFKGEVGLVAPWSCVFRTRNTSEVSCSCLVYVDTGQVR